jgi:hypothetical protein
MNEFNENGKRHGFWEHYWYPKTKFSLIFRGHYDNGEMINFWETFNGLGELIEKEFYLL